MSDRKIERSFLKAVEKMSRKDAQGCKTSPEPPWPECIILLHQPKRPRK